MGIGDLSSALTSALAGLNVNQQQLAVLSNNIANANTPGYSLQVANQQAVYLDGQGAGVDIQDVTRQVNQNLVAAVQQQNSTVGETTVLSNYNSQIQLLLGQPGSSNSLDSFVNGFFNNMEAVAQTPQDTGLAQAAIDSGVTLATQVQQTAQGLQKLQLQADGDIATAVTNVNTDITTIAGLNDQIVAAQTQGQSTANLQDQRDQAVNDMAQYLNIQTYPLSNGEISVTTGNGASLVEGATEYQLSYNPVGSVDVFANNGPMAALQVYRIDSNGNPAGEPVTLATAGTPSQVTSTITSGQIAGLFAMRDQQIPALMNQLDTLAANLRDQVNTVENSGSGFPGANVLTGERSVNAQAVSQWSGNVQIAVLNSSGQPVSSPYSDETYGLAPLTLNLGSMNTGSGTGQPSVQGIIDAINQYYGPQQNKVELGNLNNIQLVSDSSSLPGNSQFNFDLNLSNLSATSSNIYVTSATVTPSSGPNTTSVTSPVDIGISNYTTTASNAIVTVNTTGSTSGLTNGEKVYLSDPGGDVNGIPEADMTGFFTISNVTSNGFQITAAATAGSGGTVAPTNPAEVTPPYATMPAGQSGRTAANGLFMTTLGSNSAAPYYTVTLNVAVDDGSDPPATSQITYQVTNNDPSMLNTYYAPQTANGDGTIIAPSSSQPIAQAILVDANGNELPKDGNGNYITTEDGYLEIEATNSSNTIAINSLDSQQQGLPNDIPAVAGSNQGFSQYFNLNNFFQANNLTATGDSVAGSAANLQLVSSLQNDPGLLSLGSLVQNTQPVAAGATPNYTYVLNPGDNSIVQKLASLSTVSINFPAVGGLGATSQTLDGYAGAIINAASTNASAATTNQTNAQTLLTGFQQQASTTSGVNLDTELANTVIYQNAYSASARIVSVVSALFSALINDIPT